jgi:hypothetical protein
MLVAQAELTVALGHKAFREMQAHKDHKDLLVALGHKAFRET